MLDNLKLTEDEEKCKIRKKTFLSNGLCEYDGAISMVDAMSSPEDGFMFNKIPTITTTITVCCSGILYSMIIFKSHNQQLFTFGSLSCVCYNQIRKLKTVKSKKHFGLDCNIFVVWCSATGQRRVPSLSQVLWCFVPLTQFNMSHPY